MIRAAFMGAFAALLAGTARAEEPPKPESSGHNATLHERQRDQLRERVQQLRELRDQRRRSQALKTEIDAELAKDHPDRALLQQKLADLAATRELRRRERQLVLRHRFGDAANREDVRQELERHAKTLARIERLKFVAATERSGTARQRLLQRLERVGHKEEQRHQSALSRLVPTADPAPSAAPATSGGQP